MYLIDVIGREVYPDNTKFNEVFVGKSERDHEKKYFTNLLWNYIFQSPILFLKFTFMKHSIKYLFLILLMCLTRVYGQAPEIEWQKTIGGYNDDNLTYIRQTADGGYILGGDSYSGANGDKTETKFGDSDYWIVKLDASGNIVWQNTI